MIKSVNKPEGKYKILSFILGFVLGLFSVNINIDLKDIIGDVKIYKNLQLENIDLKNQIKLLTEENVSLKLERQNFEDDAQVDNNEIPIYNQYDHNIENSDLIIQINSATAKIHTAPRTSSKIVAVAKRDDIIVLRRTVNDNDKNEWYEVLVGNQIGYVRSYLAKQIE